MGKTFEIREIVKNTRGKSPEAGAINILKVFKGGASTEGEGQP